MKIIVQLPDEYDFVREELGEAYATALENVASGARPEYAAGQMGMVKSIIENLEGRYGEKKNRLREVNSGE